MRVELKDFQKKYVDLLFRDAIHARQEIIDGRPQTLVLSAPTGSGKTVMVAALMEQLVRGDETRRGDPNATFLWLSDMPELNEQSRRKLLGMSDTFRSAELVLVDHETFDQEAFSAGKVYFLNTQKLGRDRRLVANGDERTYTIWQTIKNTVRQRPSSFWLIIDEAHKGMQESARARNQAQSIVQKFIKGSDGEIPPIPLILGISATPERFYSLLGGTPRVPRYTTVDPEEVRDSGLLKDTVTLYYPEAEGETDWTLLEAAAGRWQRFDREWAAYAAAQEMPASPRPILVVQVEDAATQGRLFSRTPLAEAIGVIERAIGGPLADNEVAHSFQEEGTITVEGRSIRKLRQADIDGDPTVRVVFFKMSLSTGWDCPRAEIMMSFRPASDATLIAQLVGRMVRTPLARRVEGNDFLNSVGLYLPHYDRTSLQRVIDRLRTDPDTQVSLSVVEGSKLEELPRAAVSTEFFAALEAVPSYAISRSPKVSSVKRLIKLGRRLNIDEVDVGAGARAKTFVLDAVHQQRERLLRDDPTYSEKIAAASSVRVTAISVAPGTWLEAEDGGETIQISPENVEDLLDWCGRKLGEGLHKDYWRARRDAGVDSQQAVLELFYLLQDRAAAKALEDAAKTEFDRVWLATRDARRALPSSKIDAYNEIRGQALEPETVDHTYDDRVTLPKNGRAWTKHLYADGEGVCHVDLNGWEQATIEAELADPTVERWLRNADRKSWSVCIPYQMGEYRAMYPDFLVVRQQAGTRVVDILEPHDPSREDAWHKAIGLARYAAKHGDGLGRICYIVMNDDDEPVYLDVNRDDVRSEVLHVQGNEHLKALIRSHGRRRAD